VAGYGRSASMGAAIKDSLGSIIDHAAALLQVEDDGDDPFGATNLAGSGRSDFREGVPLLGRQKALSWCFEFSPHVVQY
jgi:hypothetical protein